MEGTKVMIKKKGLETTDQEKEEIEIVSTVINLDILQDFAENQEEMEEIEMVVGLVASILIPVQWVEDDKILEVEVTIGDEKQGHIVETTGIK